jgi:hypothetical protein
MYIPNYPEDSTLRRHFESAAELRRQERLKHPPTDSVLRRHYEQLHGLSAAAAESRRTAHPRHRAAPTLGKAPTGRAAPPPTRGGFVGWLSRLFGA